MPQREQTPTVRLGAWAGIIGPAIFIVTYTIEGAFRRGYDPSSMFVSALSLGKLGWIQIASFLIIGICFLLLALAVARAFPEGRASRASPILLAIVGLGLLLSGPFVMDPPGLPFPLQSRHSQIHNLLGAIVFSLGPVWLFASSWRFRHEPVFRILGRWLFAAGLTMSIAIVGMKIAMLPPPAPPNLLTPWVGVIQRCAIVCLMGGAALVGWVTLQVARPG